MLKFCNYHEPEFPRISVLQSPDFPTPQYLKPSISLYVCTFDTRNSQFLYASTISERFDDLKYPISQYLKLLNLWSINGNPKKVCTYQRCLTKRSLIVSIICSVHDSSDGIVVVIIEATGACHKSPGLRPDVLKMAPFRDPRVS